MKNLVLVLLCIATFSACRSNEKTARKVVETHRPQFHFTPQKGWMNDPNGMVFFKDEYHLFYQHYPDSTVWGPMHWGHAVSKNLIDWEELPIALYPDSLGYIFSGSAVVDKNNTSGFGKNGEVPLVAIFTYHDMAIEKAGKINIESQGIAYSLDKGRTWTKYANNPVIKNPNIRHFRDPKVIWHEATKQWIMTLAVQDHVEFYASKDLKNWQKAGEFGKTEGAHGGVWECPDLFPLTMDDSTVEKWVLIVNINPGAPNGGSGGQYFVGTFDGKTFKNDNKTTDILWIDYGKDNYATVTWSDVPDRRVSIGWMSNWEYANKVPTGLWRSATTLPRELALKTTEQGVRLFQKPVKETEILRGGKTDLKPTSISDPINLNPTAKCTELNLTVDLSKSEGDFEIIASNSKAENIKIGYEKATNRFYIDRTEGGKKDFDKRFAGRHYAPRTATSPLLTLNIHLDVASVELFADDGATVMTDVFFPNEDFNQISLTGKKGSVYLKEGRMWCF